MQPLNLIVKLNRLKVSGLRAWRFRLQRQCQMRKLFALVLSSLIGSSASNALAQLPTGADIVAGQAAISQAADTMNIDAVTARSIINWDSFNVGAGNAANFNLPDANSAILNRVTSVDLPSIIAGAINSNGNVFLVNPSGIMVTSAGMINTNGFTASTFDIANDQFMAGGAMTFADNGSQASIINDGTINTGAGGANLIANDIANNGLITSDGGNITLAGGGRVTLDNGVIYVQPTLATLANGISPTAGLIQNTGIIRATGAATSGGEVYLVNPNGKILHNGTIVARLEPTALAAGSSGNPNEIAASSGGSVGGHIQFEADDIVLTANSTIDASGTNGGGEVLVGGGWQGLGTMTQANTVTMEAGATIDASGTEQGDGGTIVLWSDVANSSSFTKAFGTLLARAGELFGNGGNIETSGHQIDSDGITVDAGATNGTGGLWLIDPFNYVINSSAASNIINALNSGTSVTVATTASNTAQGGSSDSTDLGDITVTSSIITGAMSGDATLILKADRHIQIADTAVIDATQNSNTHKLNIKLWADQGNSGDGINIINSSSIKTNGGSLTFGNGNTTTIGGQSVLVGGDVYLSSTVGQTLETGGGNLTIHGETILANSSVEGVRINTSGGNVLLRGVLNSGNQYTYVDGPDGQQSWNWARTQAKNGTAGGAALGDSYLVTITSRLENAIAGITAGYRGAFIGAHRANPSSSYAWTWADGPEAGQQFFTQSGSGGGNGGGTALSGWYSNFGAGEPNGNLSASGESVGQFFGSAGLWNDLASNTTFAATQASQYSVLGYVRETNLAPTALTIDAAAGSVTFDGGIGGGKALSSLNVTSAGTTINGNSLITTGTQNFSSGLNLNGSANVAIAATALNVGGTASVTSSGLISLGTDVISTNAQIYQGSLLLNANRSLTTTNGDITFDGTVNSSGSLRSLITNTGTGATTFNDIVGGTSALSSLNVSGVSNVNANITTSGNQTYGDAIAIGSGTQILTGSAIATPAISGSGNLELVADTLTLNGNITTTGSAALRPKTSGRTIGVGSSSGQFAVDNAMLSKLKSSISSITVGGTNAGAASVGGINSLTSDLTVQAGSTSNLTVDGAIAFNDNKTLTLSAGNDIFVNEHIDIGGASGGLNLFYGGTNGTTAPTAGKNFYLDLPTSRHIRFADTAASLKVGNLAYNLVSDISGLQSMSPNGNYALADNVSLAGTTYNTALYNNTFTGNFNGLGNTANGLKISAASGGKYGLFAELQGATVRYLGVTNFDIRTNSTSSSNQFRIGGLVGNVGGSLLTTTLDGNWSSGAISVNQGNTQAYFFAGGLVGSQNNGTLNIIRSYSTANVSSQNSYSAAMAVGGLVGDSSRYAGVTAPNSTNLLLNIDQSYATGSIIEGTHGAYYAAGGLLGVAYGRTTNITDSYSRGVVVGGTSSGGIIGFAGSGANYAATSTRVYTTQNGYGNGGSYSSSYNSSTLNNATNNGTRLPSGWSSSVWRSGNLPSLLALGVPPTSLYVKITGGTSIYGDAINPTYQIVAADGSAISLGTGAYSGLTGTNGTGIYTIPELSNANAYSISYLAGLSLTGSDAGLYALSPFTTSGSYSVTPRSITASLDNLNITKVYDGNTSGPSGFAPLFSFSNLVNGDSATLNFGSPVFNTSQVLTADRLTLSGLTLSAISGSNGSLLGDYTLANSSAFNEATITPKPIVISGITAADKIYDGLTAANLNTGSATFTGRVGSDSLSITGAIGAFASKNVGSNISVAVSGVALEGTAASNYTFTPPTTITGNITPKSITLSGVTGIDRAYDGTTIATVDRNGATFNGMISGDTITLDSINGAFANKNVGNAKSVTLSGATYGGSDASNYSITSQTSAAASITPKSISVSGLTASDKVYDITTTAAVNSNGVNFTGKIVGDTVTLINVTGTFADKNVGSGKTINLGSATYGGADAGNYAIADQATTTAAITPQSVTISGINGDDKVYDATTIGSVSGTALVNSFTGDDVQVTGAPIVNFNNANVGTSKPLTVSGFTLVGADAANYSIAQPSSLVANITQALLNVLVNNDAKFVTKPDGAGYAGVSFNGFVANENSSVLGGALSIIRSGGNELAGTYSNVLTASGLSASNYQLNYVNGDFTIVPAEQLLVRFGNTLSTYGNALGLNFLSAEYMDNRNTVHALAAPSVSGNNYTFNDGVGGIARFDIALNNETRSSGGFVNVGTYAIDKSSVSETSVNFNNQVNIVGNHTVNRAALSVNAGGVSKIYDGTSAMNNILLNLSGQFTNDVIDVNGQGSYATRNAGPGLGYNVANLSLSGTDANNYYLPGGTTLSGINGVITPKSVTITAPTVNKVYDGNTNYAATSTQLQTLTSVLGVAGDAVNSIQFNFDNKNVGLNKTLSGSAIAINDGNNGNNYNVTYADDLFSSVSRLSSVTWIGGASGDWNDPANWAGGAVPDLANVANVLLPNSVTPTIGSNVAGPVQLESLVGGNLRQDSGVLRVAQNATLDRFTQNGGIFSAGNFAVNDFTQNAGSTNVTHDFNVTNSFSQSTLGNVHVGGNADISQQDGDLTINQLTGGNLRLQSITGDVALGTVATPGQLQISAAGNVNQLPSGGLSVGGEMTIDAGGNVTLDGPQNDFVGPVNVQGHNVTLRDASGGIILGNIRAAGMLDVGSSDGDITQSTTSQITVAGETTLTSNRDVLLQRLENMFASAVNITARSADIRQAIGDLLLGAVTLSGSAKFEALTGNIEQTSNSEISINGNSSFIAQKRINLPNVANRFGSRVEVNAPKFEVKALSAIDFITTGVANADTVTRLTFGQTAYDSLIRPAISKSQRNISTNGYAADSNGGWYQQFRTFVVGLFSDTKLTAIPRDTSSVTNVEMNNGEVYISKRANSVRTDLD